MVLFVDRDDVKEWLASLDYDGFWKAVEFYGLAIPTRAECDDDIRCGVADQATIFSVLKALACLQITETLNLPHRTAVPHHMRH